jgi:hypothetical protein
MKVIMKVFKIGFFSMLISSASCQTITLNTPSGANSAIQCEIYKVTWSGGNGPFTLRLNDPSNNFVEEIGNNINDSPFTWTVNQSSGQEFAIAIIDSQGNTGLSGQFIIQPSSNTACLNESGN